MYDGFVEVYAKSTGEKQTVPAHWLDHPVLAKDFQITPSGREKYADDHGIDRSGITRKADLLAAIEAAPQNAGDPVTGQPGVPDEQSPTTDTPAAGDETQE